MGEDTGEKGLNIFKKILKQEPKKDLAPLQNSLDFEKNLFKDGVYLYDFEREIGKSENQYLSYQNWLSKTRNPQRAKESLNYFVGSERHEIMWKQAFSGKIPKSWGDVWYNVKKSFQEAGKQNVQLSPDLVNAGVSHSHHLVVNETGKSQNLSVEQLAVVIARKKTKDIPEWNYDEIITSQENKGMTRTNLNDAIKIADELIDMMNKKKEEEKSNFIQPPISKLIE